MRAGPNSILRRISSQTVRSLPLLGGRPQELRGARRCQSLSALLAACQHAVHLVGIGEERGFQAAWPVAGESLAVVRLKPFPGFALRHVEPLPGF